MNRAQALALWASILVAFGSPGCGGSREQTTRLNAGGSTCIYPMMSKWASEYERSGRVRINYRPVGSEGGIREMIARTLDFGCTGGPMNDEQLNEAKEVGGEVIHVPLAMGAVVPAYSLDEVRGPLTFSGPVLADIYLGKVKKWDDKALRELNPGVSLPAKDIMVIHRADGSGATHVWTDYLAKVSPEWKQRVGVGTSVNWPCGNGVEGGHGPAGRLKAFPGALCYIELTYALQDDVRFGAVRNRDGVPVRASLKSIAAAAGNALKDVPEDLRYSITDAPGQDSYPICGTVWAVLYVRQPPDKAEAVRDYLRWCTHDGQQFCEGLEYARLPEGLVRRVEQKLDTVQTPR